MKDSEETEETKMTDKFEKKENSINILCKKYFTPELCEEPITETRTALKNKLYAELLKCGEYQCDKKYKNKAYFLVEEIPSVIEECWKNWGKSHSNSYSAYFFKALKNKFYEVIKNKEKEFNRNAKSINSPIDDEGSSGKLVDIKDEKNPTEEELIDKIENRNSTEIFNKKQTEKVLRNIDKFVLASPAQSRRGREIMLTYKFLNSMKLDAPDWFLEQKKKHDFINIELVNDYYKKKSNAKSQNKEFTYTQKEDVAEMFIIEKCTKSTDKKAIAATISRINGNIDDFIESLKQRPYYTF